MKIWSLLAIIMASCYRPLKLMRARKRNIVGFEFACYSSSGNTWRESDVDNFKVINEDIVYNGFRKVVRRDVVFPSGRTSSFDVLSQGAPSTAVFVWNTVNSTATLLREYYPGTNMVMYGCVGGIYESDKHESMLVCAQSELEEEAQLSSRLWYPLVEGGNGIPFDKYSDSYLHPYLALDCSPVLDPKPMDTSEWIVVENDIPYSQLMDLLRKGSMTLPCAYAVVLGIRKVKELGYALPNNSASW